ncbi:MAG: HD-GYP domain-containing protein [Gammaproteobacteria bacterium]|nr:HD-GYP domain-containing protein [Gammaproteobacteria bacterium]
MLNTLQRHLTPILERPPLAALVVGGLIHLLGLLNTLCFNSEGRPYLSSDDGLWYNLFKIAIPFAVPWLITAFGRRLMLTKMNQVMLKYPEMNPDMIIRLKPKGEVEFINRVTREFLQQHAFPLHNPLALLPPAVQEKILHRNSQRLKISCNTHFGEKSINFLIRDDDEGNLFITGRDVTANHRLQQRLNSVTTQLSGLTDALDTALAHYDPLQFELYSSVENLLEEMVRAQTDNRTELTHLMMIESQEDGQRQAHIYSVHQGRVRCDPTPILLSADARDHAINYGKEEVKFLNFEEGHGQSLEQFQQRFHPEVRAKVGTIRSFATYSSGNTAVIAFYSGGDVDFYDASVLKGLAITTESLSRVSLESLQIENAFIYAMDALARASEANDEDTGAHIVRINLYSRAIAVAMGLDYDFVKTIHYSAQMHDVGKIHISPNILKKPGKLTDEEFKAMQAHPIYGAKILGDSPQMEMAAEIARYHHEKFNGGGYPFNLKGDQIPLSARIVAITDVYDALRQARVYKPAFSHEKALAIITEGDGRTSPDDFDPRVLAAFETIHLQMDEIFCANPG